MLDRGGSITRRCLILEVAIASFKVMQDIFQLYAVDPYFCITSLSTDKNVKNGNYLNIFSQTALLLFSKVYGSNKIPVVDTFLTTACQIYERYSEEIVK